MRSHSSHLTSTEAIVLKHMPLGEADRLVTLYTPNLGKVRAVARGVRRIKSRLGGHLDPLTKAQVLLAHGKSLATISQADTLTSNLALREDLWATTCGVYMAELVDRFSEENLENGALYRLLRDALDSLGGRGNVEALMRYFELRLLALTGFQPELQRCVQCARALQPTTNFFSAASGGVLCPGCHHHDALARALSLNALKVLRLFANASIETATSVRLPQELAKELEHLLRYYVAYTLERELKSTAFLDLIRRDFERDPVTS